MAATVKHRTSLASGLRGIGRPVSSGQSRATLERARVRGLFPRSHGLCRRTACFRYSHLAVGKISSTLSTIQRTWLAIDVKDIERSEASE
jgi:hypothetical protein